MTYSEQLYLQLVKLKLRGLDVDPLPLARGQYYAVLRQYEKAVYREKRDEVLRDRANRRRLRNKWRLQQAQQKQNAHKIKTS